MFDKFPTFLLVIISLVAGTCVQALLNYYSKSITSRKDGIYFYTAAISFIAMIFITLFNEFKLVFSPIAIIYGCVFGLLILINTVSVGKAVAVGPLGYTTIIVNFSTIITAFSGFVIWHESVSFYKYIGLIFIAISFILSVNTESDDKKGSFKWIAFSVIGMLSSALIGLTQKTFRTYNGEELLPTFLVVSFFFSMVSSLVMSFVSGRKEEQNLFKVIFRDKKSTGITLCVVACAGLCTSLIHVINLKLVGLLPTVMAFPIINGGTLLLTLLSSFVIFREKLTKKQTVGLLSGIVAFAFLCL